MPPIDTSKRLACDQGYMDSLDNSRAELRPNRVLAVDSHPLTRQGLRHVLADVQDLVVCTEAAGFREAWDCIEASPPDIIVADLVEQRQEGVALLRNMRSRYPRLPLLVLSSHDETLHAERLLALGARGYVMKDVLPETIILALRRILAGGTYVSPAVGANMGQRYASVADRVANPIERLSSRELQILRTIADGRSTRETAQSLSLSIKTIESHRQRIKHKLHIGTASMLVQFAIDWSFLRNEEPQQSMRGSRNSSHTAAFS